MTITDQRVAETLKDRINNICHSRDAEMSFHKVQIDSKLTIFACLVPKEARVAVYAVSERGAMQEAVYVTIVRDMRAFTTLQLKPLDTDMPEGLQILHGEAVCMLQVDTRTSGQIHVVCCGTLLLRDDVSYLPRFRGRLDKVQNGRIAGWAIDLLGDRTGAEIELLINGIPYLTQRASVPRPDVAKLHPGRENCGFEFNVGLDEMPFDKMTVRTRFKDTMHEITGRVDTYEIPDEAHRHTSPHQSYSLCRPVSVIVPIYNAPQELKECIDSLIAHTALGGEQHRVILSDDASPDPEVAKVLDAYDGHDGLVILRNAQNRGYTGNVNHGIETARGIDPDGDVVLLNSDTRVTPRWIDILQGRALQSPSIGTVSAMSDNAGAFSVPVRNSANPVPPWMTEDDHARMITHISNLHDLRVPTTSGFCMYIKKAVFDDIGLFDGKNFPRGYGEENDFCMRALHAGWEHAIADNVIIYHERSASFLDSKTILMDRASDMIPKMYPEYPLAVNQGFVQSGDFNQTRFNIAYSRLRYPRLPRPRVAFVIGVESGGTPQTNMDLMSRIQTEYEPYLLLCSTGFIRIFRIVGNEQILVEKIMLRHRVMPIAHDSDSYRSEIADILQRYGFELVHIRHIGRHGLSLIRIARDLNIPTLFSLHDFYTVCPNIKLLDAENRYCAGKCTEGGKDCSIELWDKRFTPKLKGNWVHSWRKLFQKVLPLCDGLITTSPYARSLIQSVYAIDDIPFHIIPHARDFDSFEQLAAPLTKNETLRIFVPGHIVPAKGLDLIKSIKALDTDNRIEFHFAGLSKEDLNQYGVYHGPYKREAFSQLVEKIKPHLGAVLSIWPETYSHTLTELWSCGLPVITSDYGATGERVTQHGGGWACETMDAQNMFDFIIALSTNKDEIEEKRLDVIAWQTGYGENYSLAIMAERYKQLYHRTMHRNPQPATEAIILALGPHNPDAFVPTSHLKACLEPEFGPLHMMVWPATTLRLLDTLELPNFLVLRYHSEPDALGPIEQDLVVLKKQAPNMKLVVEVAADAFTEPADAEFIAQRPTLQWLLIHADRVIGPAEFAPETPGPNTIDLEIMVPDPGDRKRLPDTQANPEPNLLPSGSITYDSHIARRLDTEMLTGASGSIYSHNAPFVAAQFTLIDWDAMLSRPRVPGLVSMVLPTFNRVGMTEKFIRSIVDLTQGDTEFEIILIDNGSKPEVRVQIEAMTQIDPRIRVVCAMVPLMFSVGCNYGASFARGEYILFLNNDMEVIESNWLDALMLPLVNADDIGIVGGRLLFSDRTVQHAGLVFSDKTNLAYHVYLGDNSNAPHVLKQRDVQAVTGACMAMRATDWAKLRGFNPVYVNGCEDVDLCLRMTQTLQRKSVYVPSSRLLHHEGKSPGRGRNVLQNRLIFHRLWGDRVIADDIAHYAADGFQTITHIPDDTWLAPQYRTLSVAKA